MNERLERFLSLEEKSRLHHLRTIKDFYFNRVPSRLLIYTLYLISFLSVFYFVIEGSFLGLQASVFTYFAVLCYDFVSKYLDSKKINNSLKCYNDYEKLLVNKYINKINNDDYLN